MHPFIGKVHIRQSCSNILEQGLGCNSVVLQVLSRHRALGLIPGTKKGGKGGGERGGEERRSGRKEEVKIN